MSQHFSMNTAKVKSLVPELDEARVALLGAATEMADKFAEVGIVSETDILSACSKSVSNIVNDVLIPNMNEGKRITEELLENAVKVDSITDL